MSAGLRPKHQLALAITNTWCLKYLVHKKFPAVQHNTMDTSISVTVAQNFWLMNLISDDNPLMWFPMSSSILNFYFVSVVQHCCPESLENQYVSAFVVQPCVHLTNANGSTTTDRTTQHPAILPYTSESAKAFGACWLNWNVAHAYERWKAADKSFRQQQWLI